LIRFRVIGSGSTGNATLVESGADRVLLDAGLGPRELACRLQDAGVDPASIDAVFLSHEHGDHARGAASFCRKWGPRIKGTRGTYAAAGLGAEEIPGYDVVVPGVPVRVGGLCVTAVRVAHDAAEPVAYVVEKDGVAFGHATDLGRLDDALVAAFRRCAALLVESNYDPAMLRDGPYPWSLKERILSPFGHLANGDVGRFLATGLGQGCGEVVLAHLSRKNNHPELVAMTAEAGLGRAGRRDVRVTISGPEGTGWVEVTQAPEPSPQLRLF
jgi:phosphoribosyl 1,2-cyclic phosphodiesterase